ncbi:hypothetical protein C8R44DRAFT_752667 [Mycena epipterygia]|nr:hypothetical protein C8R44DRAFT_752667 [Mycena epipterygia]
MVNLQLSFALPLIFGAVVARAVPATPVANNIFPITFVGSIVVPESNSGDTRIYYQKADNGIGEVSVTGPFTSGLVYGGNGNLIPAAQVLPGTPIATAVLGDQWALLHLFFVSPTHVLSEWIWDSVDGTGWRGGPTCSDCIEVNGFTVQPGSQVLFATANNSPSSPALLRVAFVSSGAPNTLSEASYTTARGWQLAQLST